MIKRALTSIVALFICLTISGHIDEDVKQKVGLYPTSFSSYEKLAKRINKDFSTSKGRASAIYVWIAYNISYDVKAANSNNRTRSYSYRTLEEKEKIEQDYNDDIVNTTLRKQKAVCDGYSRLFKKLCDLCDVECEVISGTSKTNINDIGKLPNDSDHAWNAVKIGNNWGLVDVTWGAGFVKTGTNRFTKRFNDVYFLTHPELFFLNHFPDDQDHLLIKRSKKDFAKLPLYYTGYIDSGFILISPQNGIITKAKNNNIHFEIDAQGQLPFIVYTFSNSKSSKVVAAEMIDGNLHFDIPLDKRKRGYLTLFYKNTGFITYKLDL